MVFISLSKFFGVQVRNPSKVTQDEWEHLLQNAGSLHRVQEQDVHSGSHGTESRKLSGISCFVSPVPLSHYVPLICLAGSLSLSPALSLPPQAGSLRNNEVQVGWPTAAALEPCSQDIHLHMTLFQVSKPQFPSKK